MFRPSQLSGWAELHQCCPLGISMQIFLSLWGLVQEGFLFPFLLLVKIYCRDLNIPNPCSSLDPHPLIPTQPTFYILCIHPGPRCLECSYTCPLGCPVCCFYCWLKVFLFRITPSSLSFYSITTLLLTSVVLRWQQTRLCHNILLPRFW